MNLKIKRKKAIRTKFRGTQSKQKLSRVLDEPVEIVSLILKDHQPIKELIQILGDPKISLYRKQPAFADFERLISCHARAEEESLYMEMKRMGQLVVSGLEGDTEHSIADQLMRELHDCEGDDSTWMAKVKVLAEAVDHHVKEEEKDVLKKVHDSFAAETLVEMGKKYVDLRSRYEGEYAGGFVGAFKRSISEVYKNVSGRVAVPLLLYFLGVPGIIVILLWAVFFRGM